MTDRMITFRDAINEAMRLEMRRDQNVILMGEDVAGGARLPHIEGAGKEAWGGVMGVSHGLVQEFGRERVLDTPISESAFIGAAMTAAATGLPGKSAMAAIAPITKTTAADKAAGVRTRVPRSRTARPGRLDIGSFAAAPEVRNSPITAM